MTRRTWKLAGAHGPSAAPSRPIALRSLIREPLTCMAALWLLLVLVSVIFGGHVAHGDAYTPQITAQLRPPFSTFQGHLYPLGTDELGRDELSRIIVGSRASVGIGLTAAVIASLFGLLVGSFAGYRGGRADFIASRWMDAQMAFPALLLAVFVIAFTGPGTLTEIIVLGVGGWISSGRLARSMALEIRELGYIESAKTLGASTTRILRRHVVPNLFSPILVLMTLSAAELMLAAASLDYLGLGLQAPQTSWGTLISEGAAYVQSAWWLMAFPGLALFLTALSINLVATWARRVLDLEQRTRIAARLAHSADAGPNPTGEPQFAEPRLSKPVFAAAPAATTSDNPVRNGGTAR
jgi:peptide/nickel transport system permease protein